MKVLPIIFFLFLIPLAIAVVQPPGSLMSIETGSNTTSLWNSSGSNIFYTDGNVGIGTNTPETNLHVKGGVIVAHESVDHRKLRIGWGSMYPLDNKDEFGFYSSGSASSGMIFYASGTFPVENRDNARFRGSEFSFSESGYLSSEGFFDINIGSSTQDGLIIKGASAQTGDLMQWRNSSNDVLSVVDPNGNIGINTSNPSTTLHVNGNLLVEGNINVTGCINYNGGTLGTCV